MVLYEMHKKSFFFIVVNSPRAFRAYYWFCIELFNLVIYKWTDYTGYGADFAHWIISVTYFVIEPFQGPRSSFRDLMLFNLQCKTLNIRYIRTYYRQKTHLWYNIYDLICLKFIQIANLRQTSAFIAFVFWVNSLKVILYHCCYALNIIWM